MVALFPLQPVGTPTTAGSYRPVVAHAVGAMQPTKLLFSRSLASSPPTASSPLCTTAPPPPGLLSLLVAQTILELLPRLTPLPSISVSRATVPRSVCTPIYGSLLLFAPPSDAFARFGFGCGAFPGPVPGPCRGEGDSSEPLPAGGAPGHRLRHVFAARAHRFSGGVDCRLDTMAYLW